ncbi:HNH endonuclease [Bradyrhizobium cenepequi]|uniref:HNH endonuclease n=1 Tax=Bradyrhizobium cenepequi TaxID=2821403 RepID=UPI001CE247D9|nr:HNH endonuclease [Bradyrhizobium cenepequi]MCA6112938.1 HNH endonuclease [Bradyrhizobium cenepequi]
MALSGLRRLNGFMLHAALRDVWIEPARLPPSANYYDDGTPRLFLTKLPNLPAGAREEGKRIWVPQSKIERDSALSADAKRLNATKYGRFTCEACAFSNADSSMFDAHHPTPLAVGMRTTFAEQLEILCPTCHRKAHRTKDPLRPLTLIELKEWCARGRD